MPHLYDCPVFRLVGDRGLLVEYGDTIDPEINRKVRSVALALQKAEVEGIVEVIPTYRSLMIVYDPAATQVQRLEEVVKKVEEHWGELEIPLPKHVEVPVCYGGDFGPDIDFVAKIHGLSTDEVISIHSGTPYQIYMIGFTPGFTFLGGLSEALHTPRLETPRLMVPAGSVGIANNQTGMYAIESPGGWRLIGRTPLKLFDPNRENPLLYRAGDLIQFKSISRDEFHRLAGRGGL
jgi:inhibitor of KinA